jgi:hypothetical protein
MLHLTVMVPIPSGLLLFYTWSTCLLCLTCGSRWLLGFSLIIVWISVFTWRRKQTVFEKMCLCSVIMEKILVHICDVSFLGLWTIISQLISDLRDSHEMKSLAVGCRHLTRSCFLCCLTTLFLLIIILRWMICKDRDNDTMTRLGFRKNGYLPGPD